MTEEKIPRWKKPSHIKSSVKYNRENKIKVSIFLNKKTEPELVEIYQSIPNKSAWFKACLRQYAKDKK